MGSDYFGGAISRETAFENMDLYIENGGNIIDTARLYVDGKSEEIIGEYLKERKLKNKIVISTKAAHPPLGYMEISRLSKEEIEKAFDTQRGEIEQIPPIYSALKVNGKRMCDLVRSGRADEINLKSRPVNIKELKVLSINENKIMNQ